jgi:hypothetical protein
MMGDKDNRMAEVLQTRSNKMFHLMHYDALPFVVFSIFCFLL